MQLNEEIRQADQLRQPARSEAHTCLAIRAATPPRQERGCGRVALGSGATLAGARLLLLELGLGEALDPGGQLAEGGRQEGEGLHGEALAVRAEGHEGVDAPSPARIGVRDAEDVGRGVPRERVAEEDGPAGGRGSRGAG